MAAARPSTAMMCAVADFALEGSMELSQRDQWKKKRTPPRCWSKTAWSSVSTGSARFAIAAIGRRVATEGLRILGIPTSDRTLEQARAEKSRSLRSQTTFQIDPDH